MKTQLFLLVFIMLLAPFASPAQTLHSTSKYWRVFTIKQDGRTVCYISASPVKKAGNYNKRGEPFALVTHKRDTIDEVSVSSGYPYKENKDVTVTIDGNSTAFFVSDQRAWAKDGATDAKLVSQMKKGSTMLVKGTSKLGTYSQDTYSLSGFTAAYGKMKSLCR